MRHGLSTAPGKGAANVVAGAVSRVRAPGAAGGSRSVARLREFGRAVLELVGRLDRPAPGDVPPLNPPKPTE